MTNVLESSSQMRAGNFVIGYVNFLKRTVKLGAPWTWNREDPDLSQSPNSARKRRRYFCTSWKRGKSTAHISKFATARSFARISTSEFS